MIHVIHVRSNSRDLALAIQVDLANSITKGYKILIISNSSVYWLLRIYNTILDGYN